MSDSATLFAESHKTAKEFPSPISELSVSPHYNISSMKAKTRVLLPLDCLQFLQHFLALDDPLCISAWCLHLVPMENNHGRGWGNLTPSGSSRKKEPPPATSSRWRVSQHPLIPRGNRQPCPASHPNPGLALTIHWIEVVMEMGCTGRTPRLGTRSPYGCGPP